MANESHRELLETKRVEIVQSINCERTILLDHLRSRQFFDQADCELIRAAPTNEARVGKLIDFLLMKGPEAYQCFLDVVQIDNPALYETLTGEKATSRPNPLMRQLACPELQPGDLSQLQSLVDYQQRMLQDLADSTKRYREVLKANEQLEKKLENAGNDLECERQRRKEYEARLQEEEKLDASLFKNELVLYNEYDKMEKGIADRDVYIIMLQMKLLAEKEESEKLKMKVEELEHKNEKMARELRRVSQNYNQERCQSIKLTECIRIQGDEIQKIDELRKQLRECKYKNMIATEERDSKIQELVELKKWTEALKTRFDVVEKEKQNSIEKTEVVSSNCVFLQETVRTLNAKLSTTSLELEEMKKRNELLTKDCDLFKTQRNYALEARREAVNSRDKLMAEKDEIRAECNDLLAKQQKMNEEKADLIQSFDSLHLRYEKTSQDLTLFKTALNEKELEVDDLNRRLKEANDQNHRSSALLDSLPGMSDISDDDDHDTSDSSETMNKTADADERPPVVRRPWRERRMKSLLSSIKTRISGDRVDDNQARDRVNLVAGNVTLDVLQHLLPNLSMRPSSSVDPNQMPNISRTIQRQMCLRKKKTDCGLQKIRSRTVPILDGYHDVSSSDEDFREGLKQASSTPNLMYPDDINTVPSFMRCRSRNVSKKNQFRRAHSSQ